MGEVSHPPLLFTVRVGFTVTRPIVPDEHYAWVRVLADNHLEATLVAAYMTICWPWCCMVTSTEIVDVVC